MGIHHWPKWLHVALLSIAALTALCLWAIVYANLTAIWSARGRIFEEATELPDVKVALIFGTTDRVNGRENPYYRYRIEAAERVWKSGKVETFIVSGDNRTRYYNEPEKMRRSLVELGIPNDRIVCDYAGLRTLDSVIRAKQIFGADPVLFISQRFHNQRAIYLAKANGIEAYGYAAKGVGGPGAFKTRLREIGARVKMWLDVNFLDTQPRHMGERITLPE